MSNKVSLEKLATGVPGLDILLDGGISRYSFNVIAGAPGSGKTTLAHQIMFSLATSKRRALFFTIMGEPPLKMLRYQQQYTFFDLNKVGSAIKYFNLADDLQKGGFDGVMDRILNEVEGFQPELIFVDSFKSVVQATKTDAQSSANLQYFVQKLGIQLSTWQATTFLIGEYADAPQEENPIFTVADGVIHLVQNVDQNAMVRKIRVVKMRGSGHMTGLHSFRMAEDGLHVYPRLLAGRIAADQQGSHSSHTGRLSTGNAELDSMLGGGIPEGYSMIVAGVPGCGKTVLATAFLGEGAKHGEHGVAVSFEHALSTAHNKPLQALIEAGKVTPVYPKSLDISIEQIVTEMVDAVDRTGARRLMIDSLSTLELVLAPQFRQNFQESLFRMLAALYSRGVTVLMVRTSAELNCHILNPSASLVDGIIFMRYVERDGKLTKLISIPKLRGSSHSDEQRIFFTHADGLEIGPASGGT